MRMRTKGIMAGILLAAGIAFAQSPAPTPAPVGGMGGKLYYAGGDIEIKVMPATAGYTSELGLYGGPSKELRKVLIATNRDVNKVVKLTAQQISGYGIIVDKELVFGILVKDTNTTYFMGEGTRNPDGIAHAKLTLGGANSATVGFEDLFGGGDRDYDDNVFQFTGGIRGNTPPKPVVNRPPDCSKATPSKTELWPPNHKMVAISISGCVDPEKDAFKIKIVSIHQDEPVKGEGSGNTSPDGENLGASVKLRAEREGGGNSRVYNITFRATDAKGNASAPTVVSVAVPHHQGAETPPKGPVTHDSTQN